MKLHDLPNGESFKIFNGHVFRKLKKIPRHDDVWDCMDETNRHRPFRGDFDVEPLQQRLEV